MNVELDINLQDNKHLYLQIIDSIITLIADGKLRIGDKVPSINQLSEEHLLSRDTVEKAYKELMKKGIIQSLRGRGYFVNRIDVRKDLRILVIFNRLSQYKKLIFESIVHTLGNDATIDLIIHHSNLFLFNCIVNNNQGLYDYYVIAPHFNEQINEAINIIKTIPKEKVILIDMDFPAPHNAFSCVYQDREKDLTEALKEGLPLLRKYQKLVLVFPTIVSHPLEIIQGFRLFCIVNQFEYQILRGLDDNWEVCEGEAYVVIEEADLATIIKKCRKEELTIGKQVGILSYNDTPLKEVLLDGITVVSTDHELMGKTVAHLILERKFDKIKNPFALIRRKSL